MEGQAIRKPLRILHVMDKLSVDGSKIHGPGRQIAYRVPLYDPDRYQVKVCALRGEDPGADFLRKQGIPTTCLGRGKFDLRAIGDLFRMIDDWQPDILHLHGYAAWTIGRIAGRAKGRRIVVQEHFTEDRVAVYQHLADWCLGAWHARAIAVSDHVADFMRKTRHVRGSKIDVIWNGVPVDALRRMAEHRDRGCRETLGLPAAAKVVGIVGRLAAMKGHRYFLEAAARLLADHPECHFVIVGDGPLRGELEAMADVLRIKANVRFVGHQADILPFLGIFDVAVIASVFGEGFATVGIEALACRVPLVITDLEVFASIYRNEENVLTVPRADPDALARAIARLLDEPGLSQRLLDGAAALLDECRIETVADRYLAVYDDMARD